MRVLSAVWNFVQLVVLIVEWAIVEALGQMRPRGK